MPNEPMTFEEWRASRKVQETTRYVLLSTSLPYCERQQLVDSLLAMAWGCGQREQMHLDHAAEMERLKR